MPAPRILIVEDETIVAMDLAATLRRLHYDVVGMVATGASAIASAQSTQPDLILMDIRIKGPMDGIEAAEIIQQKQIVPIVFLTAHADVDTVERSKGASPFGYLLKPFDEAALHRSVEIALQRADTEKASRERSADALWQSEERFRLLVEAVKDYGLFMLDEGGHIVSWNPGAERMTGYGAGDVLGKPVTMLRPADVPAQDLPSLFARVRNDGSAEWDDVGQRKDGTRYVPHIYCAPVWDRQGALIGYVSVARDVAEQRSLEAQLLQAQKLESLGQLAGGVAHDFNNMLMVIFARCDILLRAVESEKLRKYIADIRMAATRNRELTQQLLGAARQQVLAPQIINVNSVVASAMQLLAPTLGEHITIHRELHEPLWNVSADSGKLHQVLVNLAINARDAMPGGGTLTIESRNVHIDASYARRQHLGLRAGDYVSLTVSDTGSGIPLALRDRIYDPFFTTKEPGRGTGLGLAVVRGIIEQTGGFIWMYTEEGRGTAFKILLPRHAAEGVIAAEAEESQPVRGSETILLVEDEELLRAVVCEAMEEHGYHVLQAASAAEALAISSGYTSRIHVLLTDMIMPGLTGRELAEKIAAQRPETRIIFMSGYSNHVMANHATLPADVRYLEKPIATAILLETIRATIDAP